MQQISCFDLEHEEESNLTKENEWEPMDWEIREWYTELMKRASQRK